MVLARGSSPGRAARLATRQEPREWPTAPIRSIRELRLDLPVVSRARKRRRSSRGGSRRRAAPGLPEPRDPLGDLFESGGDLFLAVGYTPGGAPFGPRVEIVGG